MIKTNHGGTKTKLYSVWTSMKNRCLNPNVKCYCDYGGRGILVYDGWLGKGGFENFRDWSFSNGYSEGLTIDRIDVNGNYEPNNCRWVSHKEQMKNKRNTRYLTINGVTKPISDWAREHNMPISTLANRITWGWDESELFSPSKRKCADKKSNIKGINWKSDCNRWVVYVYSNRKRHYVGEYSDLSKAIEERENYIKNMKLQ